MKKNIEKKEYLIPTDLAYVQKASAKVLAFLNPFEIGEADLFDIRLCLEESLINAMKYGNRLQKHLKVLVRVEADPGEEIRITVQDKGGGFDAKCLDDCTHSENLLRNRGRGVYLIRRLMDRVQYNSKGNTVLMVKRLRSGAISHRKGV